MRYSKKSIKNFSKFVQLMENKKIGTNQLLSFATMALEDERFTSKPRIILTDDIDIVGYTDTDYRGDIYLNPILLKEIAIDMANTNISIEPRKLATYNYYHLLFVLHELEHYYQFLMSKGKTLEPDSIKKLYKMIFKELKYKALEIDQAFEEETFQLLYERNANLNATSTLVDAYSFSEHLLLAQINHMCYICSGYGLYEDVEQLDTPFDYTFDILGLDKSKIDYSNLDFETLFNHGLPIPIERFEDIFSDERKFSERDYSEFVKKIK